LCKTPISCEKNKPNYQKNTVFLENPKEIDLVAMGTSFGQQCPGLEQYGPHLWKIEKIPNKVVWFSAG